MGMYDTAVLNKSKNVPTKKYKFFRLFIIE